MVWDSRMVAGPMYILDMFPKTFKTTHAVTELMQHSDEADMSIIKKIF